MDTPIYDFIENYKSSDISRFHMPGHKGHKFIGCEDADITEIEGADVLSMADGIIARSQANASRLFCTGQTFYSTEGSSLCIKAMLMSVLIDTRLKERCGREYVLAARNVHRSMIDACALIDIDVKFIGCMASGSICNSSILPDDVEKYLKNLEKNGKKNYPMAVYITSPDYLGNIADIAGIAAICERYFIPLVVDNAHGAYLTFLEKNLHPIKLGAAMCCDSAHKTLPVLTGGAYLHISEKYKERYTEFAKKSLALFGSTSPSYLILQSLDLCNRYISDGYKDKLKDCIDFIDKVKNYLKQNKIPVLDTEPLKIVINMAKIGYTGFEAKNSMRKYGIECEYADYQFVVLMATPENTHTDFERIKKWGSSIHRKDSLKLPQVCNTTPERKLTIREAVIAPSEIIDIKDSVGRICAQETVSCPPAIPIVVCGEVINENTVKLLEMYNIKNVCVVSLVK